MKKNIYKFKKQKKKVSIGYIIGISVLTFLLALFMQSATQALIESLSTLYAFVCMTAVVLLGILADILGVAITTVDETPFHAMAAEKVRGAKETINLIKNAEKVSNIANDVIGDVCGIISGGIAAFIVSELIKNGLDLNAYTLSIVLAGMVSSVTVGGKAIGKFFAMSNSSYIVFFAGRAVSFFKFKKRDKR